MEGHLEDPIVEIRQRIGKRNEKTGLNVTHLTPLCAKHLYIYIIQDITGFPLFLSRQIP